jgi:hypothetical protein
MMDHLRTLRTVTSALVLGLGLPCLGTLYVLLFLWWASPGRLVTCDVRPFPAATLQGQLLYYWSLMGGWMLVWLSGLLVAGRWPDRLRMPSRVVIALLPLVLAGGMALYTCRVIEASHLSVTPVASVTGLGRMVSMELPPGTTLIEAKVMHALDWAVAAKVTMPTNEILSFIKGPFASGVERQYYPEARLQLSSTEIMGLDLAGDLGVTDWHPERLRRFICACMSGTGQHSYALAADLSERPNSTVYLYVAVY